MPTSAERDLLVHAQIGDRHVATPAERNDRDLLSIAAQIGTESASAPDVPRHRP